MKDGDDRYGWPASMSFPYGEGGKYRLDTYQNGAMVPWELISSGYGKRVTPDAMGRIGGLGVAPPADWLRENFVGPLPFQSLRELLDLLKAEGPGLLDSRSLDMIERFTGSGRR